MLGEKHNPAATDRPFEKWETILYTFTFCVALLPAASYLMSWANAQGLWPIRPLFYTVAVSCFAIGISLLRRKQFCVAPFLVFLIPVLSLLDLLILRRYTPPGGLSMTIGGTGSNTLMVLVALLLIACFYRFTKTPLLWFAFLNIVLVSGSTFMDAMGIIEGSKIHGRAAGFAVDCNQSCNANLFALTIFLTFSKRPKLCFVLIGVCFLSAVLTLSRSGMLSMAMITMLYVMICLRKKPSDVIIAAVCLLPIAITLGASMVAKKASEEKGNKDAEDRMAAIFSGDFSKMRSGDREHHLKDGLHAIPQKPFFGYGVGSGTAKWCPHNMLVTLMLDGGLILLGCYLLILLVVGLGVLQNMGQGIMLLFSSVIFIPFSQTLVVELPYWIVIICAFYLNSQFFFSFRVAGNKKRPQFSTDPGNTSVSGIQAS